MTKEKNSPKSNHPELGIHILQSFEKDLDV